MAGKISNFKKGHTVLMLAAAAGAAGLLKTLLTYMAVDATAEDGSSAAHFGIGAC